MAGPSLIKPTTNAPGSSTLWGTADNGAPLIQIGSLADYKDPNGVESAVEIGLRVLDQAGDIIMDSIGISQVMKVLGSALNVTVTSVAGSGSWQAVAGTSVSFTLSRQGLVLGLGSWLLYDPLIGDSGYELDGTILVDGVQNNANAPIQTNLQAFMALTPFAVATLDAGAHTMSLGASMTSGHNYHAGSAYLYVFQLGG